MKKYYLLVLVTLFSLPIFAQTSKSFSVGGDLDKYYPVIFNDANFALDKETMIEIGRSNINRDGNMKGSLISKFRYHINNYGHRSEFIHADIQSSANFIAGWRDMTTYGTYYIAIWLKGGTSYSLSSAATIIVLPYDGVQNALPFLEPNGSAHTYKTQLDEYVANYTSIQNLNAYYTRDGNNYFKGNVGIGTPTPREKLSVNGNIRAHEIKVETANWPDYVFANNYVLTPLLELEKYIQEHKHLPEIPSASVMEKEGIELGQMNKKLLQKIEELTLHLIAQQKKNELQENSIKELINRLVAIENIQKLERNPEEEKVNKSNAK